MDNLDNLWFTTIIYGVYIYISMLYNFSNLYKLMIDTGKLMIYK